MRKYLPYIISFGLILSSMFIGNGYTPICAVVCLLPCALSLSSLIGYSLLCLVRYTLVWSLSGMTFSHILFQIVMLLISYACLLTLPSVSKKLSHSSISGDVLSTLVLCLYYWWSSNSICFLQMSGLVPSWKAYPFNLNGYLSCLFAGRSFFINSLVTSLPMTSVLSFAKHFRGVSLESVSLSR